MPRKTYVCPTCGLEEIEQGNCPDCGMEMEEICSRCGNAKSECVCKVDTDEEESTEKEKQ